MRRFFRGAKTVWFLVSKGLYLRRFFGGVVCRLHGIPSRPLLADGWVSRRSSAHGSLSHKAGFLSSGLYGFFYISWENNRP
jgi:hypothetical protein